MEQNILENEWQLHRNALSHFLTLDEQTWERVKFHFQQGLIRGYIRGYEDRRDGWDADYPAFQEPDVQKYSQAYQDAVQRSIQEHNERHAK